MMKKTLVFLFSFVLSILFFAVPQSAEAKGKGRVRGPKYGAIALLNQGSRDRELNIEISEWRCNREKSVEFFTVNLSPGGRHRWGRARVGRTYRIRVSEVLPLESKLLVYELYTVPSSYEGTEIMIPGPVLPSPYEELKQYVLKLEQQISQLRQQDAQLWRERNTYWAHNKVLIEYIENTGGVVPEIPQVPVTIPPFDPYQPAPTTQTPPQTPTPTPSNN